MSSKKLSKFLPLFILFFIASSAWIFDIYSYITIDTLRNNQIFLQEYVTKNNISAIAIYCSIYFLVVSASIPTATILTLTGGFLFDPIIATICIVISASTGACVIFLSTKMATKNSIKAESGKWVKKMQKGFEENAFLYMLTLRFLPIFPFVIINVVAGILQVQLRIFFFGTLIGIIPATFIYASVGSSMKKLLNEPNFSLSNLVDAQIIISLSLLALMSCSPIIYKKLKKAKKI